MGIVYVISNPLFEDYLKIGSTENLKNRLRQHNSSNVPLPFRCLYAVETENYKEIERLLQKTFKDFWFRKEFYAVDPQRVISALKAVVAAGGVDVTPREDIEEDEKSIEELQKVEKRARKISNFKDAGLSKGDEIYYAKDDTVRATIINEKKILFEGEETNLSASALKLLQREGYKWKGVNGWLFWMFEGKTINELLHERLDDVTENVDDVKESNENIGVSEKIEKKPRKSRSFKDAGLSKGDEIYYAKDDTVRATIIDEKKILFEGEETNLSASALKLIHRSGKNWKRVNGWSYWMFEGKTLEARHDWLNKDNED